MSEKKNPQRNLRLKSNGNSMAFSSFFKSQFKVKLIFPLSNERKWRKMMQLLRVLVGIIWGGGGGRDYLRFLWQIWYCCQSYNWLIIIRWCYWSRFDKYPPFDWKVYFGLSYVTHKLISRIIVTFFSDFYDSQTEFKKILNFDKTLSLLTPPPPLLKIICVQFFFLFYFHS